MNEPGPTDPSAPRATPDPGVAESVRAAVERTMRATAGSAAGTRERAGELVDEVVRRGREARDELARRGQEAGAELARRGQDATGEVGRRLELLEQRLVELESRLGPEDGVEVEGERPAAADTDPEVEG
jgi:polyhydroxyalkanoate synthesis regulator phasin